MQKEYVIYTAERRFTGGEDDDPWYHAFLLLVEQAPEGISILQQLHYNDGEDGRVLPNVRKGVGRLEAFRKIEACPVITGQPENILEKWNYALAYAFYLRNTEIFFSDDYKHGLSAVNCRSAVIATLRSVGISYHREHYAQDAGTRCTSIPLGTVFNEQARGRESLERLWELNENFYHSLAAHWAFADRYVGPLGHEFSPMRRVT